MGITILVIDDDYFMRKLIEVMLVKEGYSVLQANNAAEAIEKLANNQIEIITCDIMMPDIDGIEFISTLKSDPKYGQIPIIVITAAGAKNIVQLAKDQGACCVVEKPFSDKEITGAIKLAILN